MEKKIDLLIPLARALAMAAAREDHDRERQERLDAAKPVRAPGSPEE